MTSDDISISNSIGVGIDLGTTNSAIAYLNDSDEPCIIEIPNNGRTIKSVVVIENDNDNDDTVDLSKSLVGNDAIEWERQHKETTAYRHVKRVIGTCAKYLSVDTKQVVPHLVPSVDDDDDYDYDNKSKRKKGKSKKTKKNKPPTLEKMIQSAKDDPTMLYPLDQRKVIDEPRFT